MAFDPPPRFQRNKPTILSEADAVEFYNRQQSAPLKVQLFSVNSTVENSAPEK
ncbi:predicted protein [Sclerotinia sclerotiorum 1980 UF-70]|uniref:Uncharacterized protein n=1 Tax=Sclerotinia sclerotiorum (strain ATCC 18683 / 1980 / Ss-1) TaxID=665079 RepID=A7ES20_SCLS1|nr:predicted protein [Sclerotinia sclerotiorum 1980 UF-70]EDN92262.1 predicted protein [Sclerotinia sclerotiorum 1980 UF-70]